MRVWDVSPGYLNRGSLLGEHRELHGIHSILVHGKRGYARHPETRRWKHRLSGIACRHAALVAEMSLRGYVDRTPIVRRVRQPAWPATFVTSPGLQYALLRSKYRGLPSGRIPLPRRPDELWAHHKYSVLARDEAVYRDVGRRVSRMRRGAALDPLAEELVLLLRHPPAPGSLTNAVEHMWGYVAKLATEAERQTARRSRASMLLTTCGLALRTSEPYLLASTALSDLLMWATPAGAANR